MTQSAPIPLPSRTRARSATEREVRVTTAESAAEARPLVWKVHDRTHIECGIDWPLDPGQPTTALEWDAYFFVPESLRLEAQTYDKQEIYGDLRAYVRLAVPDCSFAELAGGPLAMLAQTVGRGPVDLAVREMRFFACHVRAAAARAHGDLERRLGSGDGQARSLAFADTARALADLRALGAQVREVLRDAASLPEPGPAAAEWVGEDVSRLTETFAGELSVLLHRVGAPADVADRARELAVEEARHRRRVGLPGVAWAGIDKEDVEQLEFRRHVLKRFTASVLWLFPEIKDPSRWVVHLLYAVAAGVAMAFAVGAALWNGIPTDTEGLWMWATIAVVAYMAKDRIKAFGQGLGKRVVSKRIADRRWVVRDRPEGKILGHADERAGFVPFEDIPPDVLAVRRATRVHPLEEQARPETVLWHHKDVSMDAAVIGSIDGRVDAMREILRLDLRHWLAHTDDPKRHIVFADPDTGEVCSATAPRVYNIGIIYRMRRAGDARAPWRRVRVVVTRKGIRRIDPVC